MDSVQELQATRTAHGTLQFSSPRLLICSSSSQIIYDTDFDVDRENLTQGKVMVRGENEENYHDSSDFEDIVKERGAVKSNKKARDEKIDNTS